MKILLVLTLSLFSIGAFACTDAERKIKVTLDGTSVEVEKDVCSMDNGASDPTHGDLFKKCKCANIQVTKAELEGNATTVKHCDSNRVAVEFKYIKGQSGGAGKYEALPR